MRFAHHATFTKEQVELAEFAKCLAHPARIAIVTRLMESPELCCSEIVEALPLAQATVSQHLRALERAGLLIGKPDGIRVCYRLDRSRLKSFCHAFQETLQTAQ
jgi:ArsR family transcriptional regulator